MKKTCTVLFLYSCLLLSGFCQNKILGEWEGKIDDKDASFIFKSDKTFAVIIAIE